MTIEVVAAMSCSGERYNAANASAMAAYND